MQRRGERRTSRFHGGCHAGRRFSGRKAFGVVGRLGILFAVVVVAASGSGNGDLGSQRGATVVVRGRSGLRA
jgi:hypothetical protein